MYSGLIHFWAVLRFRLQENSNDDVSVKQAYRDLHGWFYEHTGEVDCPERKLEKAEARDEMWTLQFAELVALRGQGDSKLPDLARAAGTRMIEWPEIAQHNTVEDCWVVVGGLVYDISRWLPAHPGGAKIFQNLAGRDITQAFKRARHSRLAHKWLAVFQIGRVKNGN